jgi:hypothetical protein
MACCTRTSQRFIVTPPLALGSVSCANVAVPPRLLDHARGMPCE